MAEVVAVWRTRGRAVISVLLSTEAGTPLCRLLESSGSEVVQTRTARQLSELVARRRPGLVIAFGLRASLVVRLHRLAGSLRRRPWPRTFDARNGLEAGRGALAWLVDRTTQRLVDGYVTNSDAAARTLVDHGVAPDHIRVLYSAIGDAWQPSGPSADRERASVAMVGNARPEKQQRLGLEVFARLREPAHLVVYTNDASDLRRRWSEMGGSALGEVSFREGHTVTPEDLRRTAVLLHPSSHESAPRCLMEGRASGCHVVAFDVGDTRRIVGDDGQVLPPGDADRLATALEAAVHASRAGVLAHPAARYSSVDDYVDDLDAMGAHR